MMYDSLIANGPYHVQLFDHSLHLSVNYMPVTGAISEQTGKEIDAKAKYHLHRWSGGQSKAKAMYCKTCNVNLCIHCYILLNTEPNIVERKQQ